MRGSGCGFPAEFYGNIKTTVTTAAQRHTRRGSKCSFIRG